MMPGTHSILSASAAYRWLNCPPSARLTADMPENPSGFASEGTVAHSLAELKVLKKFTAMKKSEYDKRLKEISSDPLYESEMDGCTNTYLDYILTVSHSYNKVKPYVAVEKRLDFSHIVPDGYGTGDCIMMCKNDLHIFDFKYGKGVPVSAENNPQLMLYALGAINEYGFLYDIKNITLHIIQPRLENGISSWSISAEELMEWGNKIAPTAQLAYTGGGNYCAGDWCRFCKAKNQCRARAELSLTVEPLMNIPPALLSDSELGEILTKARLIKSWISDIEEYALKEILNGGEITGWKAVEGVSRRKIRDIDTAYGILIQNGIDENLLYERTPIGITALEKLIPKNQLSALIGSFIEKPKGKPTLAEASDKRAEYKEYDVNEIFGGNNND